jgi:polyhydroxyalkanoate synthesis regulator phasin
MTDSERIAALEAKVAKLEARLEQLIKSAPINQEQLKRLLPSMMKDAIDRNY